MEEITKDTFQEKVHNSEKPVVVDFWGEGCQPCVKLAPVFEKVAETLKDKIDVFKINIVGNAEIFAEYGVASVPTLVVFKNGEPVANNIGFIEEEALQSWIEAAL